MNSPSVPAFLHDHALSLPEAYSTSYPSQAGLSRTTAELGTLYTLTRRLRSTKTSANSLIHSLIKSAEAAQVEHQAVVAEAQRKEEEYCLEVNYLKAQLDQAHSTDDGQRLSSIQTKMKTLQASHTELQKSHSTLLKMQANARMENQQLKARNEELQQEQQELRRTCQILENVRERLALDLAARNTAFESVLDFVRCAICSLTTETAFLTECGHIFCTKCVTQWLAKKPNCPVCRADVDPGRNRPLLGLDEMLRKVNAAHVPGTAAFNPILL
ncbi:hypothetical protein CCMSSC00406_0008306 [Pleurotus cornucopiae]|uniref:Uncharacterized protein n=1 Tax=Pleurotus cornucopiae TaxID=5321 RepID=A0ACB7IT90_PLECO|nr:hypothetical protein CCMSSC00406_0008306 [Pleurotus cornucopiae]